MLHNFSMKNRLIAKSKILRTARMLAGHSQGSLARHAGYARSSFTLVESGHRTISAAAARAVARELKFSVSALFSRKADRAISQARRQEAG
jgi:DNA-binding XRE family transcriptional regulator